MFESTLILHIIRTALVSQKQARNICHIVDARKSIDLHLTNARKRKSSQRIWIMDSRCADIYILWSSFIFLYKMADSQIPNCVGDGDKQQPNADIENLTQYVN